MQQLFLGNRDVAALFANPLEEIYPEMIPGAAGGELALRSSDGDNKEVPNTYRVPRRVRLRIYDFKFTKPLSPVAGATQTDTYNKTRFTTSSDNDPRAWW